MTLPRFDPGFSTAAMTAIFDPRSLLERVLRFESELAAASAEAGVVPTAVAEGIERACREVEADPGEVLAEGWEAGTPLIPLLDRVRAGLGADASRWLHHGSTSQDALDTALALQMGDGLDTLTADLSAIGGLLADNADRHRHVAATARTLLQPAGPTTLGLRCARWLAPVPDLLAALTATREALPLTLGGPAGDLSGLGLEGRKVSEALGARLGLRVPPVPAHSDRTWVAEAVAAVLRAARSAGRIGSDLVLLAGLGEASMRAGASSSIPGKRNPVDAVRAVAAAEVSGAVAQAVLAGRPSELERGAGGWQAEWLAVPLVFHTAAAALGGARRALETLEPPAAAGGGEVPAGTDDLIDRAIASYRERGGWPA